MLIINLMIHYFSELNNQLFLCPFLLSLLTTTPIFFSFSSFFLPQPIIMSYKRARTAYDKDTVTLTYFIPCAASAMQGDRRTFEDRYMLSPSFDWKTNSHLFGVFDGHGGYHVAEYCKNHFATNMKNRPEYKEGRVAEALTATFLQMDEPLWYAHDREELLPDERESKKFRVTFDPVTESFGFEKEIPKPTPPKEKVKDAAADLKYGNTDLFFFFFLFIHWCRSR